jgi:hypothetical protein
MHDGIPDIRCQKVNKQIWKPYLFQLIKSNYKKKELNSEVFMAVGSKNGLSVPNLSKENKAF